ncbi:MAG TPA: helix-turn-helix domain-containing protein [Solirubrobacteraceae bacterium]|nr:helix-turn-helix domain-containing protein [Solirubrobacteraceae bacterium]
MAAFTELLADRGYAGVTISDLAGKANVSRATFYEHFADKQACLFAAYDEFALTLLSAMTADVDDDTPWSAFIDATLAGYLGALEQNPTGGRAFIVEMDSAGPEARRRRREAARAFAALIAQRHATIRARDPSLGPWPERVYLGLALGVRELVREALEDDPAPRLTQLASDIVIWITATVEGATAAQRSAAR